MNISNNVEYANLQKLRDPSLFKTECLEAGENRLVCNYYNSRVVPGYKYKVIGGLGAGAEFDDVYGLLKLVNQTDFSFKTHIFIPEMDSPGEIPGFKRENYFSVKTPLNKTKDELWMGLEKETRNMIRKSQKNGVVVKIADNIDEVEDFVEIRIDTLKRCGLPVLREWEFFSMCLYRDWCDIYVAKKEDKVLGGFLLLKDEKRIYYSSPGTSLEARKLGVNNALIWEAIKNNVGKYDYFDYWGIVNNKNHPEYSITRFKKSFNPIGFRVHHFYRWF